MSQCYNNIGSAYRDQKKYNPAVEYLKRSLKIASELGEMNLMAIANTNIAELHVLLADSSEKASNFDQRLLHLLAAVDHGKISIELAKEVNAIPRQNEAANTLKNIYLKLGNYKMAMEYANVYIETKDSMFHLEKTKAIAEMQTKYETEKKQQEIEKQQLLIEKQQIDNKKNRNQRNFFIMGTLLLSISVIIILRSYRQKKISNGIITEKSNQLEQTNEELKTTLDTLAEKNLKLQGQHREIENQRNDLANLAWELQDKSEEVEKQKNILSEKNKEITDSIVYAQRIQSAVLPSNDLLRQLFTDHFILYEPKSIVSGDFYWATQVREFTIFCVTDCTGHGVPGAFMSMMGVSLLNEIVRKEEVTNAAQILDQLRDHVISSMGAEKSESVMFDGMDIGLCVLDRRTLQLQYAGANIPCWIASSSFDDRASGERIERLNGLLELKPDRMPIGRYDNMDEFTLIQLQLKKNDTIYMATDGFADQFGGSSGKKYQKNRLMTLLSQNHQKPLSEQRLLLENEFDKWKGAANQIDDVTVLGVRI